jgi:hypothetical protein
LILANQVNNKTNEVSLIAALCCGTNCKFKFHKLKAQKNPNCLNILVSRKIVSSLYLILFVQELDPDLISNFAIDLNLDEEHRSLQFVSRNSDTSKPNSVDSGSVCRTPSDTKNVTFNPQVINIDTSAIGGNYSPRKHWHIFKGRKHKSADTSTRPAATRVVSEAPLPKTILCVKRRNSEEECFSRTEALPLLSGLNASSERTSPNFVRRKKYVYPVEMTVKGESSV